MTRALVVFLAVAIPVEIILCRAMGITGLSQYASNWPSLVVLAGCVWYTRWRPLPKIIHLPPLLLLTLGIWGSLSLVPVLAARCSFPLVDAHLAHIDAALGVNTASVVRIVRRIPLLRILSAIIYMSTSLMIAATLIIPPIAKRIDRTYRFLLQVIVALFITSGLFLFWPAVGPWTVEGFTPNRVQSGTEHFLLVLRSGTPLRLDRDHMGIVSFPSFHVVLAILTAHTLSCFRWLRWPVWALTGLICITTVTTGWHYGVDVIGGALVAMGSIWVTSKVNVNLERGQS